jgi:protocatechuate 3,4-dioxygenase beta subunit
VVPVPFGQARRLPGADRRPVGDLLRAQLRHPYRPAHLHVLAYKLGFKTLITQVFVDDDEHLKSDVVFGVTLGN